ncbi:hypothetical protein Q5752_001592 [Cryptotrichosporon argae]
MAPEAETDPVAQTNLSSSDLTPTASSPSTPSFTPSPSDLALFSHSAPSAPSLPVAPRAPWTPTTTRLARPADAVAIAALGAAVFKATFAHTCSGADMRAYLSANFTGEVIAAELAGTDKTFLVVQTEAETENETRTETRTTATGTENGQPGGRVVAFSALRRGTTEPCLAAYGGLVELQRVYVDNVFHGSGIARRLLDATCVEARRAGHAHVWLGVWEGNDRARRFYEKYGFRTVGSHDFWLGTDLQVDLIMVMPL